MKSIFKKAIPTCLSFLLVVGILAPPVLKLSHIPNNHFVNNGSLVGISQLQKSCVDCDFQKTKITPSLIPSRSDTALFVDVVAFKVSDPYLKSTTQVGLVHVSLRAPPTLS